MVLYEEFISLQVAFHVCARLEVNDAFRTNAHSALILFQIAGWRIRAPPLIFTLARPQSGQISDCVLYRQDIRSSQSSDTPEHLRYFWMFLSQIFTVANEEDAPPPLGNMKPGTIQNQSG